MDDRFGGIRTMKPRNPLPARGLGLLILLSMIAALSKLCGVIDWSWWWIFAPFWSLVAVGLFICLIVGFAAVFAVLVETYWNRKS
jgi:hypothetical protein